MAAIPTHPAPQRHKIGSLRLLGGLVGAPACWVILMTVCYLIASNTCDSTQGAYFPAEGKSALSWLMPLGAICTCASFCTGAIAYRDWLRVQHETQGNESQAINSGAGRTRFLSLLGLMSSGLFITAILFILCALWLISPCKSAL